MNFPTSPTGTRRDEILTSLARLYSVREDMRKANRPVTVHGLTIAIKIRTESLRALDKRADDVLTCR